MRRLGLFLFALAILAIVAWGVYRVTETVRASVQQVQRSVEPVQAMQASLSTQVAQVLHPTPTIQPDPITIIHQVKQLARLETVQYTIEKVITARTQPEGIWDTLFGDRLIFIAHGIVIAGVDLSKLGPEDIWIEDGVLYVRLPEPEIFIATLDNQKSYVYDREKGLLTKGEVDLETAARKAAEQAILEAALEDGILERARINAEAFLTRLFAELGYPRVRFVYDTPQAETPTPTP
ncbi:MAG: DUF4230 domain-containing protein [Chloroflexi bacterium]|nr:DUF4230 domain-containing protein [Chloroflexota bacterium]